MSKLGPAKPPTVFMPDPGNPKTNLNVARMCWGTFVARRLLYLDQILTSKAENPEHSTSKWIPQSKALRAGTQHDLSACQPKTLKPYVPRPSQALSLSAASFRNRIAYFASASIPSPRNNILAAAVKTWASLEVVGRKSRI